MTDMTEEMIDKALAEINCRHCIYFKKDSRGDYGVCIRFMEPSENVRKRQPSVEGGSKCGEWKAYARLPNADMFNFGPPELHLLSYDDAMLNIARAKDKNQKSEAQDDPLPGSVNP